MPMRKTNPNEQGFSMLEGVVVIGIIMVVMGMAIYQSSGSFQTYTANSAQYEVVSQLTMAREMAISQRRYVQVTFNSGASPQTISYQVLPRPGSADPPGPVVTLPLPQRVQFMQEAGLPDTPMNFGTCSGASGVCIANVAGGPAFMEFTSTGQFTDNTGVNLLNGTVFVGIPNQPGSARAITIMGGTGRVRPYIYDNGGSGWRE
jgi:type II secretory pathway pseudopilin PulG